MVKRSSLVFSIHTFLFLCSNLRAEGLWDATRLEQRKVEAMEVRIACMMKEAEKLIPDQPTNGDLDRYSDYRASYAKALKHKLNGHVNPDAFKSLLKALTSEDPHDFNHIQLGGNRKLTNPQSGYAFTLEGCDGPILSIKEAPAFASAETAAEMVELYWGALLRDIPFNEYATNPIALAAVADLNTMSDFRGPKIKGKVTPETLWRGNTPGDLVGPYISQFLYQPIPLRGKGVDQFYFSYKAGIDYMTTFEEWFIVQNGGSSGKNPQFETTPTFIHNARDLGTYVHKDFPGEAFFNAALILSDYGPAALDKNNPYKNNPTQEGFVTYSIVDITDLVTLACRAAMKAAWYQKWLVHLRLRPEYFGFLVDQQVAHQVNEHIHKDLINSPVLNEIFNTYGSYFLPQMFPEGSPTHPAYPAGHASIAGACATILKAFFNEDFVIPNPLQPNATNTALESYSGTLHVRGELNKLAANIALGRDFAGVHYRSDGIRGMLLGEAVAISILQEEGFTKNENFKGFCLTKFDGTKITIGKKVLA